MSNGQMTEAELASIEQRNKKRKKNPAVHYQWGCAGTHRGRGTKSCPAEPHHHHDDRCEPPVTVDVDTLVAEVKRLRAELEDELRTRPPFACPTCDWWFQTWALREKHLESGACPGIAAAAALTGVRL